MTELDLSTAVLDGVASLRDEPHDVRRSLAALGRLLGAALAEDPRDIASFAAGHLGVSANQVATVNVTLHGIDVPLVQVVLARLLETVDNAVYADDTGARPPAFELVQVDVEEHVAVPDGLAAYLPAGEAFDFDAVLVFTWHGGRRKVCLHVRRRDYTAARAALSAIIDRARTTDNVYRGKALRVSFDDHDIEITPIRLQHKSRSDVVHAAQVWAEVDANIDGLVRHGAALRAAGLGTSRGMLISGPPGVGKTALCRVIASELPEGTTAVIVDSATSPWAITRIYQWIDVLSPVAVFLDDIDLLAGDRRQPNGVGMLREFLTSLDGFTPTSSVVTVATTNVTDTIDPALIRPGRFDALIEVPLPNRDARIEILRRFLAPLGEFDLRPVADGSDGLTGADLRELVRRAVLENGEAVTTDALLDVMASGRWQAKPSTGQYL